MGMVGRVETGVAGNDGGLAARATGPLVSGPRLGGLRHGPWRIAHPDGSAEEGRCFAGRLYGTWVPGDATGKVVAHETWCHGRTATPAEACRE